MKFKTYHADGSLAKEIPITYITPPKKSPNGRFVMCEVRLETGQRATLEPEHLDRYYPGWRSLVQEEPPPTPPEDKLKVLNQALTQAGKRTKLVEIQHDGYDYLQIKTSRGGRIIVPLVRRRGNVIALSVLRAVKWQANRWLCNGQAGTGTKEIIWWGERNGPTIGKT